MQPEPRDASLTLVEQFSDLYFSSHYYGRVPACLQKDDVELATHVPGYKYYVAPASMILGPPDEMGFACWKPVKSPIDAKLIQRFERYLGAPLPPVFARYLSYKCMIGLDLIVGTLPAVNPDSPLSWLEWQEQKASRSEIRSRPSLIPFTDGPALANTLCFDTENERPDGDYPIIQVKMNTGQNARACEFINGRYYSFDRVFDSCRLYFEFLTAWLVYTAKQMPLHISYWIHDEPTVQPPKSYYE